MSYQNAAASRAIRFLEKQGIFHGTIDVDRCIRIFREEMVSGLRGQGGSLAMIPTFIDIEHELPVDRPVGVIDAGGTNLRVALVTFDEGGSPRIEDFSRHDMPGIGSEISKDEFFGLFARYVKGVAAKVDRIGFCFSYPVEITPEKDGRALLFSKEIKAQAVVGELVGENLARALADQGVQGSKRIVVLNDTVATLLAGRSGAETRVFDSFLGYILGTGVNASYIEHSSKIEKLSLSGMAESQIINTEAGGFDGIPAGELDRAFHDTTNSPGEYPFEKMVSGGYLGPLAGLVLTEAAEAGELSPACSRGITALDGLDSVQMCDFLFYPFSTANPLGALPASSEDRSFIYSVCDNLLERSAKCVAISMAATVIESGAGIDPCKPVCITIDGSTYYKMRGLRLKTEYYLKEFLQIRRGIHFETTFVENAPLLGTAVAGLTN